MAVKRITNIFAIGNAFDHSVFSAELLDLQTAQIFCGRPVNRVQVAVLFLVFVYLLVDMLHDLQGKCAVLRQRFSVIKHLQFIERGDAKRCRCSF